MSVALNFSLIYRFYHIKEFNSFSLFFIKPKFQEERNAESHKQWAEIGEGMSWPIWAPLSGAHIDYILILYTEGWTGFVDTEGFVDIEDLVHTAGFSSHGAD